MPLLRSYNCETLNQRPDTKTAAQQTPWPLQVEMRVPFEPTAFPSGPHVYLMYELHLTNFMPMPVSLRRLQPLGGRALSDPKDRLVIADGQSAIAFMSGAFDRGSHIPDRLLHRHHGLRSRRRRGHFHTSH